MPEDEMDWGMRNRLARIIRPPRNRALMLAVDHGYFLGPTERLEEPRGVIAPLLEYCDSLMLTRGVQRSSVDPRTDTPMVLRVSGGSSIIGEDLSREDITVSIRDAVRLNASALAMSIFVGSKYEYQTIANLGRLVSEAEEYGIPVLAVTAVGKELGKDARYLSLACRVAAEQGARVVKTYYCDGFERVVKSCPVPIIVAGGKKIPERDALQLTYNAVAGGAAGVDMGRNIWQSDHPVSMIRAVREIVHGGRDADQAYSTYRELVSQEGDKRGPAGASRPGGQKAARPGGRGAPGPGQKAARPGGQKTARPGPGPAAKRPGGPAKKAPRPGARPARPAGTARPGPAGARPAPRVVRTVQKVTRPNSPLKSAGGPAPGRDAPRRGAPKPGAPGRDVPKQDAPRRDAPKQDAGGD